MTWIEAIPSAFALLTAFFLPGALFLLAARLPWQIAVPVAPAVSVLMATIGALMAEPLGLAWGLATFSVASLIMVALAWLVGRWVHAERFDLPPFPHSVWAGFGLLIAVPVATIPLMLGFGAPDNPAPTYDAVFHLNALRRIIDTGDGSTLTLGIVAYPEATFSYYPAGWHDIVSVAITDAPLPLYANLATLVIAGLVYPAGLILIAAAVFPTRPVTLLLAPVLGSSFVAFPARMFTNGTLWPAGLSTALVPAAVALVILVLSPGKTARQRILLLLTLMAALGGGVAAQPTALFAVAFLSAPYLLWRGWHVFFNRWRARPATRDRLLYTLTVAAAIAVISVAFVIRIPQIQSLLSYGKGSVGTQAQAVGEAVFDAMLGSKYMGNTGAYLAMAALTILGILIASRHRSLIWLIFSYAAAVGLFALAAGPETRFRALVGVWYKDPVRLGGLVPLFATLLSSLALAVIIDWIAGRIVLASDGFAGPVKKIMKRWSLVFTAILVVTIMFLTSGWFRADERRLQTERYYINLLNSERNLLSEPELAMIERLDEVLPDDGVILGNPRNGSAFIYALTGHQVVFAHIGGSFSGDRARLAQTFDELNTNPEVCELLSELGVDYFYDDTDLYSLGPKERYDKLSADAVSEGLELLDSGGTARIYKITACDD